MTPEKLTKETIAEISSDDPSVRWEGAESVKDFQESISDELADQIARALVTAARSEHDDECLNSQIDALHGLLADHTIEKDVLTPVLDIAHDRLEVSEREYLDGIQAYHDGGFEAYWRHYKTISEAAAAEANEAD